MNILIRFLLIVILGSLSSSSFADVRLPKIFSDNMVVQRDQNLKVWGWAKAGESVKVEFNGQSVKAKASKNGTWTVTFKPMKHGGPFEMKISGKTNNIVLQNILIGDVWLGSGQSNMEWIMNNTKDASQDIPAANYPKIRLFTVDKTTSYTPEADLSGGPWLECTPQNVQFFSAVAYYFGRKLHEELDVPIGLINSSWGGTKIEPWISWDLMGKEEPYKHIKVADHAKNAAENKKNEQRYIEARKLNKGELERWFDTETKPTGWQSVEVPNEWGQTPIGDVDGIIWFQKEFELPAAMESKPLILSLGPIDDEDVTYVNGTKVGALTIYNKDRIYPIKQGILKAGKNLITVKVTDNQGGGGMNGKPEQLYIEGEGQRISLAGTWTYKKEVVNADFGIKDVGPNSFASLLYNAMIAPIVQYPIRGVIWYQGESNANEAYQYRRLFPMLINDWRAKWGYEMPFFWVQLANFMAPSATPGESAWAELREAQNMTLSLPATGQAVIIDIGEADDIHPRNKKDVGHRLALSALHVAYGKDIVYEGPVYESLLVAGDRAVLTFKNADQGLKAYGDKYGYLKGFAIAGADKKFVWAKAYIEGDKVVVHSESVKDPVAVRYAWGDNPDDANLYNNADLPASPFRTDTWKGVTFK
ncbi:MAG TPA: sialate O-acetylesterase [Ohtaekwangia sp.]|nr:sialate O-acetylesterase [Ohtaekwangia sp.]